MIDAPLELGEFERLARDALPSDVFDYIQGGSGTESTLAANRSALDSLWLRPRVLVDVSTCELRITLLGHELAMPVGVAPVAYHRLAHPDGEVAMAQGAGDAGALLVVSIFASRTLEEIAAAATGPLWLQLYWLRERERLAELIARAEAAGFGALVLTVDAPWVARRLRDSRSGFAIPEGVEAVNVDPAVMAATHRGERGASAVAQHSREQFDPTITWSDLAWLRERTRLPLVLKGILTAEDATLAVAHGVDAIVVSNHGGRQLDGAVASARALPEVVAAVDGRCPVIVDGGIRRGADVLKVLALGADAAWIGRPAMWGLAHAGRAGVAAVLTLLRAELEEAMALAGRPNVADLNESEKFCPRPTHRSTLLSEG